MTKENKILITGGAGMVGSAFKKVIPDAAYPSRQNLNLLNEKDVESFFSNAAQYDAVIHLAARVGGIRANTNFIGDFFTENIKLNTNLLNGCMLGNISKVVSLLSTCVYPDSVSYPLTEDQLHNGEPHSSNFGYAYAKRMLEVQSRAYRQQYGCNFICAIPNNLYGENDNFDLENSHVIPALIRKIWEAKTNNNRSVEIWGDGTPLREFTYSGDIANILLFLLNNYDEKLPINIGHTAEYSIKEIVSILCEFFEYDGNIKWNTDMPMGQYRKPSSNKRLLELGWKEENYTSLRNGLKKTCKWFIMNYPHVRGVK
tara:strand:- start:1450 stop:2391 length:942 start_codon:yes stop_codon:yes gene_type:complete